MKWDKACKYCAKRLEGAAGHASTISTVLVAQLAPLYATADQRIWRNCPLDGVAQWELAINQLLGVSTRRQECVPTMSEQ
jgi:hypothetical protein